MPEKPTGSCPPTYSESISPLFSPVRFWN